ncbi:hypothetical protein AXFE_32440 [Acidithrix ferrooxidans]|uniref:Uncharacterized protein n=1 Tax=Acidithrix ferrooxidans TaxID=1280514 RepID=A0A0D8HFU2_9ACTN|nr:hypothetical protein AXFE_32440 [Acidithrix ferrooxidans]CAG4916520.1 unnamed protein product [Acidithrix sp. C25]
MADFRLFGNYLQLKAFLLRAKRAFSYLSLPEPPEVFLEIAKEGIRRS